MFSRVFTYPGYDGQPHKDERWFNLSDAEIAKMNLSTVGGINEMVNRMLRDGEPGKIVDMFEMIILKSVGEKSLDGRRFIKKEIPGRPWGEIAEDFRETPAYSELFVELVSSADKLKEFMLGAISDETRAKMLKASEKEGSEATAAEPSDNVLPFVAPEIETGEPDAP